MDEYLQAVHGTLLVLGSENLAKDSSATIGSFCMSVAKALHHIPLLIAKVNSVGICHRAAPEGAGRCPFVAFLVEKSCQVKTGPV